MLGTTCDDWDEDRILSGGWDRDWATGENDQRVYYNYAGIERRGYTGSTSGVVTWDGQWFTITFSHTALASLNLRCVGIANEGFEGEEYFYFDGYEPFVVTAASATREWKSYLARTRGFKSGWAKCPREEVFSLDKGRPKQAICMAQYKVGKTWRFYTGTVSVKAEQPSVKSDFSRKWVRRWHSCRKPRWARDLKGRLRSNYGCDFLMAGDADYLLRNGERVRSTFWHGTNTAGFQTVARFRCRHLSKRAVTCRNRLGDAFRYSRGQPRG